MQSLPGPERDRPVTFFRERVDLPCRCQCGAVGIKPLRSYTMKAINEHVGWGTDGHGLKVLFCNKCREVFYRTPDAGKAIQAQRVFSKKHQCAN